MDALKFAPASTADYAPEVLAHFAKQFGAALVPAITGAAMASMSMVDPKLRADGDVDREAIDAGARAARNVVAAFLRAIDLHPAEAERISAAQAEAIRKMEVQARAQASGLVTPGTSPA